MKMRYSKTSPFARKALVTAHEIGLAERIELVATNPWAADTDLQRDNPLIQVPALTLEGGEVLYDSVVIAGYLDELAGAGLFAAGGIDRWRALRRVALADGICNAAALVRVESTLRPEPYRWPDWIARQRNKVAAALKAFEAEADAFAGRVDIVQIALGCALGYLDLRLPDPDWRGGHPKLAGWYEEFGARPSMQATRPDA